MSEISVPKLSAGRVLQTWPLRVITGPVCSLPIRFREDAVGVLNLYRTEAGALSGFDTAVGQALADVAGADTTEILYSKMFGQPDVELCKRVSSPR